MDNLFPTELIGKIISIYDDTNPDYYFYCNVATNPQCLSRRFRILEQNLDECVKCHVHHVGGANFNYRVIDRVTIRI